MLRKNYLAHPVLPIHVLLISVLLMSCACPLAAQHKATSTSRSPHAKVEATSAAEEPIDLNTASRKDLESLPGIGGHRQRRLSLAARMRMSPIYPKRDFHPKR